MGIEMMRVRVKLVESLVYVVAGLMVWGEGSWAAQTSLWEVICPAQLSCENGSTSGPVIPDPQPYPSLEFATQGTYKSLTCGRPENLCTLHWLKNGRALSYDDVMMAGAQFGPCNSSLEFMRTQLDAAGSYECVATDAVGNTTVVRRVELSVKAAPLLVKPVPEAGELCANQTAVSGSDVTFSCDVFVGSDTSVFTYWKVETSRTGQWDYVDSPMMMPGTATNLTTTERRIEGGYVRATLHVADVSSNAYTSYILTTSASKGNTLTIFSLRPTQSCIANPEDKDRHGRRLGYAHSGGGALWSSRWILYLTAGICLLQVTRL